MRERPKFCRGCGASLVSIRKGKKIQFNPITGEQYDNRVEYLRCAKRTPFIWSWGHSEFYDTFAMFGIEGWSETGNDDW